MKTKSSTWNGFERVVVTSDKAIVKKGSICRVQNTGNGFWLIRFCNGRSAGNMSLFLIEGRDFVLAPKA